MVWLTRVSLTRVLAHAVGPGTGTATGTTLRGACTPLFRAAAGALAALVSNLSQALNSSDFEERAVVVGAGVGPDLPTNVRDIALAFDAGNELIRHVGHAGVGNGLGQHDVPAPFLGEARRFDPHIGQDHAEDRRPLALRRLQLRAQLPLKRADPLRLGLDLGLDLPLRL